MNSELREFYRILGEKYPEEKFVHISGWGIARKRFIEKVLFKKYISNGIWADIGCGGGVYLNKLRESVDFVIGVDIALGTLLRAKKTCTNAKLICGDAENLPIASNCLSGFFCSETLEHLEQPNALFKEANRTLTKGGTLIITCPNWHTKRPVYEETGILENFGIKSMKFIHTAYTPEELADMAAANRFEILETGTFEKEMRFWGGIWDRIWGTKVMILRKIGVSSGFIVFIYKVSMFLAGLFWTIINLLGIAAIMKRVIRRGPRSYIVARKI